MAEVRKKMLAAYSEIANPPLDSTNPHYKSKFSSLKASLEAIRPSCVAHGIMYTQTEITMNGEQYLVSAVSDEDEEITLSTSFLGTFQDPQKKGIALTYLKRQQIQADWGIVGEEDTDGEGMRDDGKPKTGANTRKPAIAPQNAPQSPADPSAKITDERYAELQSMFMAAAKKAGVKATDYLATIQWELGFDLSADMDNAHADLAVERMMRDA